MPIRRLMLLLWLLLGLGLPAQAQWGAGATVTTERVRAQLLAHAPEGVAAGKTVWLGLQFDHQPHWHTYWKNPGDSGLPTTLTWKLPAGVTAGEIAWPVPRKIPVGNLANYGYEGRVLLAVPLTIGPDFKAAPGGSLDVGLQAQWLICRQECIPEEGAFKLQVPAQGSTAAHGEAFRAAWQAQPQALAGAQATARVEGGRLQVRVTGLPAAAQGRRLELYPETAAIIEPAGAWTQGWQGASWQADLPVSAQRSESPQVLPLVLADAGKGWVVQAQMENTWPPAAAAATVSPALAQALQQNAAQAAQGATGARPGLLMALLGALAGGLILNLMPCVFPVLAIKVVGFAQHAQFARTRRLGGLAFTLGVILSFLALGAAMLALRAAGEQLGWGFQLQSPVFVAALAALFTLIGLNLVGAFEFGHWVPSGLASLQVRHPVVDSALSGVLAVAVASPCTAPFMGASVGLAVSLPTGQALAIFAMVGLGMSLPYLAASWMPGLARALPRPGAWMEIFRRLMAFPMLATVVWLAWVLGQQVGIDGVGALLALLVCLSLLVWALGLSGRARVVLSPLALAIALAAAWAFGPVLTRPPAEAGSQATPAASASLQGTAQGWQPWSPQAVQEALAGGKAVFVDYTAAWCVTCQYNKKTVLEDPALLADFAQRGVRLMRADWTRRDPAITASLAALGRSGVPVYVLQAPGRAPVVLSELLTREQVRAVLASL